MKRIVVLVALVVVVYAVSVATSSQTDTSLVIATALVAGGVLVHSFIQSFAMDAAGKPPITNLGELLGCLARNVLRLAIGAVAIAWMVVSAIWFFGA